MKDDIKQRITIGLPTRLSTKNYGDPSKLSNDHLTYTCNTKFKKIM